jgi:hypothetical protein
MASAVSEKREKNKVIINDKTKIIPFVSPKDFQPLAADRLDKSAISPPRQIVLWHP